jgi:hypothetical protein
MKNSRWTTNPIKKNGQIVGIKSDVDGDIEILKALARHSPLPAEDIAALNGRSYPTTIRRINKLKRKPNQLIKVCDTQLEQARLYQWCSQAYQLAPAGIARLNDLGLEVAPKSTKHFIHSITEAQTSASFEVGAKSAGLEHVVLEHKSIPVTFTWKGQTYEQHKLTPDGGPIGLGYGNDIYRFMVFETDCATEPLESSSRHRQAIETKIAAYLEVLDQRLYEKEWDIPNFFVLFTTTTQTRLDNMRQLLAGITNKYRDCFGFQLRRTILQSPKAEQGAAVLLPWLTINGQLNLAER